MNFEIHVYLVCVFAFVHFTALWFCCKIVTKVKNTPVLGLVDHITDFYAPVIQTGKRQTSLTLANLAEMINIV